MATSSIVIHKATMSDEMQREALQCALLAVHIYEKDNDIATYIAKEFDRKYQPTWQCIMGSFGGFLQHKANCYISFSVGNKHIVLFKTY